MIPSKVVYLWQVVTGENTVHNVIAGDYEDAVKVVRELRAPDVITPRDVTKAIRTVRIEAMADA